MAFADGLDISQASMRLPARTRKVLRIATWTMAVLASLLLLSLLVWIRGALYNRFVRFPREAAAWAAIRLDRHPVAEQSGWKEYRGLLHSHSFLSHDSNVPFEEILRALQQTGRDFICLSDHCTDGRADFSAQWRGLHGGKLFVPGFEMRDGLMPFGVRSGVVLTNRTEPGVLAKQIIAQGGLLFYAHPEEPRAWDLPELTGMEIYNIHADFKDEGRFLSLLPDLLINQRRYPEQVLRRIFDTPVANLQRWDALNATRHITGIAGNDCHQNVGLRLICTGPERLRLEDTSPKTIREFRLNFCTRPLFRAFFGRLTPGQELFRIQLDPYERSIRFVTTHVLAKELSEQALLESLKVGRAFVAFDLIADSTGFTWRAQDGSVGAIMGESISWSRDVTLHAAAPHPCRFTVLRAGSPVYQTDGLTLDWRPPTPGVYRVEAELKVAKKWTPWVYANPIWLR